jgi:cytochrome d ubiquinol oxidase subunit II
MTWLRTLPMVFALAGLVLYTVLAGADFGAGLWQLVAGRGERGRRIRDFAHHANAPVWEANHVWVIFTITVIWTAYPVVFPSVATTLSIPLSIAAVGIIFRGMSYAFQSATEVPRERRFIDLSFALSSIITPYMLGALIGGIASGRVPVGNAAGDLVTSWVNPTSIVCGILAVATGAFLAAVYLAADARRLGDGELESRFRMRALLSGVAAGAASIAGLIVVSYDVPRLFDGLTSGWGLAAVVISGVAGLGAMALVWLRRFEIARGAAALAVAALIAGWAAAQRPIVLVGLTLQAAAAGNATLIAVLIAIVAGGLILAPSLAFLFRLSLTGRLDHTAAAEPLAEPGPDARRPARTARIAIVALIAGIALVTVADEPVAHVFGIIAFAIAAVAAFTAVGPDLLAAQDSSVDATPLARFFRRR